MKYFWSLLKNIDKTIVFIVFCFMIISAVMISSTASQGKFVFNSDVQTQLFAYFLGALAACFILTFDYNIFERFEKLMYVASILLLLTVYIPGLGIVQFGARSWIDLRFMTFQPSEAVKIAFIILLAIYFSRNYNTLKTFKGVFLSGIYAAPFIVIIALEDFGNAIVFCFIWLTMVFYAGISYKILGKSAFVFALTLPIVYRFMADHQKARIDAFLHPENLDIEATYQVLQSKIAIGSGGFLGKGLFQGTQKDLDYVPVQKSDFIFSVIVEELGMLGGIVLIALYSVFLFRIANIARNAKENLGAMIAIGFVGMFGFQIFQNIAMTMGLMPVTGITLPFISYGGSSILANMAGLGLILNVGIRNKAINF